MITGAKTIYEYAAKYNQMCAMVENISEFLATMPAPDNNGDYADELNIPGVDYAWLGSVNELHAQLTVASEICDHLSE